MRWQIHWGERVAKEGLWKLYEGDYSSRLRKFNHRDIVDYPPVGEPRFQHVLTKAERSMGPRSLIASSVRKHRSQKWIDFIHEPRAASLGLFALSIRAISLGDREGEHLPRPLPKQKRFASLWRQLLLDESHILA